MGMASAMRRVMQQHHGSQRRRHLNWSAAGQFNTDSRTLIPAAQPQIQDFEDWGFSSAIMKPEGFLYHPRAGNHVGVGVRPISQLIATKGSHRLFLVDTLALAKRLESQGLTSKQAEAITAVITEVLNDSLENVGQSFTSKNEMQRSELIADAALSKFKGQVQSSQEHHFAMLQQETERLRTDIDKMRNELRYAIDKVTSGQRLDLNLERGRIREELATQATETADLTNKLDREIHTLKTQLEAAKFDVIKYCIGTIVSVTAVGLGLLRIIM